MHVFHSAWFSQIIAKNDKQYPSIESCADYKTPSQKH